MTPEEIVSIQAGGEVMTFQDWWLSNWEKFETVDGSEQAAATAAWSVAQKQSAEEIERLKRELANLKETGKDVLGIYAPMVVVQQKEIESLRVQLFTALGIVDAIKALKSKEKEEKP